MEKDVPDSEFQQCSESQRQNGTTSWELECKKVDHNVCEDENVRAKYIDYRKGIHLYGP